MDVKKRSFEAALKELEEIAEHLKSGSLTLDESLRSFEQGMKLYEECNGILSEVKQKIEVFGS